MSNPTFVKISGAVSAAVATNDTIVLDYPAGYSSSTVKAAGAKLWAEGLQYLFSQTSGQFSVAYSSDPDITITYLGSTSIPAGTKFDFYLPVPDALDALTDSTGGTASQTVASITAGASYAQADMTACKNGLASIIAKITAIQTALKNANLNPS